MMAAYYFLAPPAGSDSGLRPPQGQSRCKNIRQPSLNNIHKLAKQITPFTSYQDTISFLSEPYRSTPVFYWNRLRAPSLSGEDRIYYFRATYIHLFWNRTGLFYFRNTLNTYLFWISTRLFYFSEHPIHISILN